MTIPGVHNLVSEHCSPLRKPELLREMTDSRARAGGVQDELGTSCYAGKKDILKE